jgi:hypothetical protein
VPALRRPAKLQPTSRGGCWPDWQLAGALGSSPHTSPLLRFRPRRSPRSP